MVDTLAQSAEDIDVAPTGLSKRTRFWLLTVASVDVLIVITSMVTLNAALPDIALETNATQGQLTRVVDGYTLVLACLLPPAGAIGDRYGRRDALLAGLGILALAVFFDSPLQTIAARAVAGIGAAFIMPATLSLLIILAVTLTAGSTRDELGGSVTQHDDGGVGAAAGDGRQDRPVDHP